MVPRPAYTLFMLLTLVVFFVLRRLQPSIPDIEKLPWKSRAAVALAAFIGGALGAKLPFALADGLFSGSAWLTDGKTLVTGLAVGYVAVEACKLLLGIRVKTGDLFALPLAGALAVGRWGCFFNGCCYGIPTDLPWGVDFGDGVKRHPTQIYESLFHLAMAGVLLVVIRRGALRRQRLKLYLIGYGLFRFVTEYVRPEPEWLAGLTFYQWAAAALTLGLALQWLADRHPPLEP